MAAREVHKGFESAHVGCRCLGLAENKGKAQARKGKAGRLGLDCRAFPGTTSAVRCCASVEPDCDH